jgi:hypothetical protein
MSSKHIHLILDSSLFPCANINNELEYLNLIGLSESESGEDYIDDEYCPGYPCCGELPLDE